MRRVSKITLLCLLLVLLLGAGAARAQGRPASLDDVVLLAQSGLSDDTILSFLETRPIGFVLSATSIVQLRAAGVSEVIIRYLSVTLPMASPLRDAAAQVPIFRAGTEVVTLTATVLEDKSGYVTDLEREDFTVYEDGASQTIAFFRSGEQASVSMAIVIDTSGSMATDRRDHCFCQRPVGYRRDGTTASCRACLSCSDSPCRVCRPGCAIHRWRADTKIAFNRSVSWRATWGSRNLGDNRSSAATHNRSHRTRNLAHQPWRSRSKPGGV